MAEREQPDLTTFDLAILAISMFFVISMIWLIAPVSDAVRNTVTNRRCWNLTFVFRGFLALAPSGAE